jgi:hypothetical protein
MTQDELLELIGYTEQVEVYFSPETARANALENVAKLVTKHRSAICAFYASWKREARRRDDVLLVAALADFLVALVGAPAAFTVAALLVLRGLDALCQRTAARRTKKPTPR